MSSAHEHGEHIPGEWPTPETLTSSSSFDQPDLETMAAGKKLEDKHLDAAEAVLNDITDKSKVEPDPKDHLHVPATHDKAHSLFRSVFPYDSLEEFESQWHLGNYVADRKTGQKTFEAMSIYVRLGMHLLYYGSEQQNLLRTQRAQKLLKDQSVKMGKQYDSPESKDHIQPFIESFGLQGTLAELVSLCTSTVISFPNVELC
jgi:phosphatidylserine decarboxylase